MSNSVTLLKKFFLIELYALNGFLEKESFEIDILQANRILSERSCTSHEILHLKPKDIQTIYGVANNEKMVCKQDNKQAKVSQ